MVQEITFTLEASDELGSDQLLERVGCMALDLADHCLDRGADASVSLHIPLAGRCIPATSCHAELVIRISARTLVQVLTVSQSVQYIIWLPRICEGWDILAP